MAAAIATYFLDHNLSLPQPDKDGGIVVLPRGNFNEKVSWAMDQTSNLLSWNQEKVGCPEDT